MKAFTGWRFSFIFEESTDNIRSNPHSALLIRMECKTCGFLLHTPNSFDIGENIIKHECTSRRIFELKEYY